MIAPAAEAAEIKDAGAPRSFTYGWYATGVLMLAYTFSFLDRQILNLMVGPIERDLHITDSQFALLAGGAFGIFYTLMGLPIGWMADRFSRKWIVTAGIACWSVMTAGCGLAGSYLHLFLTRIGVGVGEATLSPSAYSMLSDYFDKKRLPRAMSVYTFGIFIGAGLAMILGGVVVQAIEHTPEIVLPVVGRLRSWQAVFMAVGLPGLLLALWIATLCEPVRRSLPSDAGVADKADVRELFRFLARSPLMCLSLFIGSALFSILGYADTWYPELFIRTWGWSPSLAGGVNGSASLIAGPLGLIFAGWYSSHLLTRGKVDACLRLTALGAAGIAIPALLMPLMPHPMAMAAMLFPIKFFVGFPPVLIPAAFQMVAPNRLRGQLGAVFLFTVGIIGVTCGPILPAFFSDYVFKGSGGLRYALAAATGIVGPIAFCVLWVGLKQYRQRYRETSGAEG